MTLSASAWATLAEVRERIPGLTAEVVDDPTLERAIEEASEFLSGLSGVEPMAQSTVVPVPCGCRDWGDRFTGPYPSTDGPFYWLVDGGDLMLGAGRCPHGLLLPANPVIAVTSVKVDGVEIDSSTYELVDANQLRRLDHAWWSGRVEVSYTSGGHIGAAAKRALAVLAAELGKAATPGQDCSIPQRVQTIQRQGVIYTMLDPQTFLDSGRTGIYWVDLFLTSVSQVTETSSVVSPDSPHFLRLRS